MAGSNKRRTSFTRRIIGASVATMTVLGAIAAVAVVPEVRCWLNLDACPAPAATPSPSGSQIGISNRSNISAGESATIIQQFNQNQNIPQMQGEVNNTGILNIQGNLTIGNTIGNKSEQDCTKPYLQLRLDDRVGTLIHAPNSISPRRFRILLGNPSKDCVAIVDKIYVEVVDVIEDHNPALEALTAVFRYSVNVSPQDKGRRVLVTNQQFNYTPLGKPDQIVIDVFSSARGYAYALRFNVEWSDLGTGTKSIAKSWIAMAPFPAGQGEMFGGERAFNWRREQLIRWRQKFDSTRDAVEDAKAKNPPYVIPYRRLE